MATVGLILPTSSYRGPDFVAAADELGVDLVVASDASLGLASGRIIDVLEVDCSDPAAVAEALVERSEVHALDAVVGVDDAGVVAAAMAAQRLGLDHNSPEAAAATRNKLVMRRMLAAGGVPQPRFAEHGGSKPLEADASAMGYPAVIKPISLAGSRGVIRVDDDAGARAAADRIAEIQIEAGIEGEALLVEEYLPGAEVAVEGLLAGGEFEVLAIFDKPDPLEGPFFEETLYVTPSRHDPTVLADVSDIVGRASTALGLSYGPVHAEVRLTPDGPRIIEVAARSIGGLCGRSLQFGMLAQSLEILLLRAALGMNRRGMGRVDRAAGAMMIPIPADGVLRGVRGGEAVAEVDGITDLTITVANGRRIRRLPEGDRYLGFMIASGDDPTMVEEALRQAHDLLRIEVEPIGGRSAAP